MKLTCYTVVMVSLLVGCSTLSRKRTDTSPNNHNTNLIQSKSVQEQPKLVVGIVVDQMRYDYLTRFGARYGQDGFNRLINGGYNCKNNHFDYVPTYTAPGHASIYTGTSPMNNGIIANNWYDKYQGNMIYNASDDSVQPIGTTSSDGKMSPHRLLTTTVTDELELHTQGRATVIGVSIKDRGAILPAGHAADGAYWYRGDDQGAFISSTYYRPELPKWVSDFNASNPSDPYLKTWSTLYPIDTYTASGTDVNDYERAPHGKSTASFPYDLKTLSADNGGYSIIKSTPFGNSLVTDFAIAALVNEQMGSDDVTDFLAISYSSTDYVGHTFGVNSVEIEDTYLRLDQDIARLLSVLDQQVGMGNYTVFLTADHGAVNNPAYLQSRGINAGYLDARLLQGDLELFLEQQYQVKGLVKNISNNQVFLNYDLIASRAIDMEQIQKVIANYLTNYKQIDKVFTRSTLTTTDFTSGVGVLVQKGFHHKRSGDVVYVPEPAVITYPTKGSTHGSSQSYDTHVPLLFYGAGIKHGATVQRTHIIDIAPTVSSLLGIGFPNGATGNPIEAVLQE